MACAVLNPVVLCMSIPSTSLRLSVMKFLNNMMYLLKLYLDNGALHLAELLAFLGILVSILSVVLSC